MTSTTMILAPTGLFHFSTKKWCYPHGNLELIYRTHIKNSSKYKYDAKYHSRGIYKKKIISTNYRAEIKYYIGFIF